MADDKIEPREFHWRQLFPWVELFRGFRVALGLSKLGLAATGILAMAIGWFLLAVLFYNLTKKPDWNADYHENNYYAARYPEGPDRDNAAWKDFHKAWERWSLMYETAGPPTDEQQFEPSDLAESLPEYQQIQAEYEKIQAQTRKAAEPQKEGAPVTPPAPDERIRPLLDHFEREHHVNLVRISQVAAETKLAPAYIKAWAVQRDIPKPAGALRTWPWFEDRGPNPFLLVTGKAGIPWETGHFWDWLFTKQIPVLLEPLIKFLRPAIYFFSPRAYWLSGSYFVLDILWLLIVWALFGGAITRMVAVEVARNEKINAWDALRFVWKRYLSYLGAPILPLVIAAGVVVLMIIFGALHMIPVFGDIVVDGLFWWLALLLGLALACLLVGLVTWPLMTATISTEDEEPLNAFARAYSYLIQAPWHYLWYTAVALAYGAVLVFFVGFMGSFLVYLASWGVSSTPGSLGITSREPQYLFVYAPTSFQWRSLLMQGATVEKGSVQVVQDGVINQQAYNEYVDGLYLFNKIGAVLVTVWIWALFLLILGFGYSYFWTASTIIYLLMRRQVDDAELDEVYFEEDEQEDYSLTPPTAPAKPAAPPSPGFTMVEAPSLRVSTPPPATSAAPPATPPLNTAPPLAPAPPPPPPLSVPPTDHPAGGGTVERSTPAVVTPPPPAPESEPGGQGGPPLAPGEGNGDQPEE